jgi:hypothetical protein
MSRKEVAAASAEVERLDFKIGEMKEEAERIANSIRALNVRLSAANSTAPDEDNVSDADALALLDAPEAPVSSTLLQRLLGSRKKAEASVTEARASRAAIRKAIAVGKERQTALGETLNKLWRDRREAMIRFNEAAHACILAEMEAKLAEASGLATILYAIQESGEGRISWHLEKDARVALKRHAPSISGKFEERELFPKLPRRHGRNEVKVLSGPAAIAAFRDSLRGDQPKIKRAA